jgi:choline dehydrogenase-like flavoprotein
MRKAYSQIVSARGPVQEIPVWDARVQVDPKVKDYWGIPVARFSGGRHLHTIEICKFLSRQAARWVEATGATGIWRDVPGRGLSGGQHQAGTCRMGDDARTSVVDKHCRVHDVDNLFVADASVHVTNGGFNPVLTIMAIAYRASAHILEASS